jgi:hypothetical protein
LGASVGRLEDFIQEALVNAIKAQKLREQELERNGWSIQATIPIETLHSAQSKGKYPEGSVWIWSTGRVWSPPNRKGK